MPTQVPYPISGTVTVQRSYGATASNVEGARVWIYDKTEGTKKIAFIAQEDIHITTTNSSGQYILDVANLTSAYSDNDSVEVWVEVEGYRLRTIHTLSVGAGSGTVNIVLYRRSGLKDGLTRTVSKSDRQYGVEHFGTGMTPGLRDGLVS